MYTATFVHETSRSAKADEAAKDSVFRHSQSQVQTWIEPGQIVTSQMTIHNLDRQSNMRGSLRCPIPHNVATHSSASRVISVPSLCQGLLPGSLNSTSFTIVSLRHCKRSGGTIFCQFSTEVDFGPSVKRAAPAERRGAPCTIFSLDSARKNDCLYGMRHSPRRSSIAPHAGGSQLAPLIP